MWSKLSLKSEPLPVSFVLVREIVCLDQDKLFRVSAKLELGVKA